MNTPAHLIFGAAAFGKPQHRWTMTAAVLGGLAPDLSLYLLVGWHLLILGTPPEVVFGQLYFSETWQRIFAVDNSVFLWCALLAVAIWRRWGPLVAFAAAGLLHLFLDFPLHAGDGRPHFWPLSMWVFDSPFSYWDNQFGARWIGPLELGLSAVLMVVLWRRVRAWGWRILFAVLLIAQAMVSNIWRFIF
ncbi:MAG: cobalamin biosynthesis protein CobQ [Pseudomonadota bacterium]